MSLQGGSRKHVSIAYENRQEDKTTYSPEQTKCTCFERSNTSGKKPKWVYTSELWMKVSFWDYISFSIKTYIVTSTNHHGKAIQMRGHNIGFGGQILKISQIYPSLPKALCSCMLESHISTSFLTVFPSERPKLCGF